MIIRALTYRKQHYISYVEIPEETVAIGDAAFSLCPMLKNVTIPASVDSIGVAAFCASGLEEVTFLGVPKLIEQSAFAGCEHLKQVVVPMGAVETFKKMLPSLENLITDIPLQTMPLKSEIQTSNRDTTKSARLIYNQHAFVWQVGDKVELRELFSRPIILTGEISYQFRKKCLFVFMRRQSAASIVHSQEYMIPANTFRFSRKYQEKYGTRSARIFLFVCDDSQNATFYDEVKLVRIDNKSIIVKSNL